MTRYDFSPDEWPERALFRGSGSMNYPEGKMRYVWEGRGTRGAADCLITEDEIRLRPKKVFRAVLGWPELVLAREDIRDASPLERPVFRSGYAAPLRKAFEPKVTALS